MIEINLAPSKNAPGLHNVGGFNLSLVNVKMVFIALILFFVPEIILSGIWESEWKTHNDKNIALRKELKGLQKTLKKLSTYEKQIEALNEQEQKLKQKLKVVKQVLSKRQNPFGILQYVAQNIPEDVWLVELNLMDTQFEMKGYSKDWKSIGSLLENLKSSIFLSKNIQYEEGKGLAKEVAGRRVESFGIRANILRFE